MKFLCLLCLLMAGCSETGAHDLPLDIPPPPRPPTVRPQPKLVERTFWHQGLKVAFDAPANKPPAYFYSIGVNGNEWATGDYRISGSGHTAFVAFDSDGRRVKIYGSFWIEKTRLFNVRRSRK